MAVRQCTFAAELKFDGHRQNIPLGGIRIVNMFNLKYSRSMKQKINGITYTLSLKTLTAVVSECDEKKEGKVVLPAQVEHKGKTYAVTEIGHNAFAKCTALTHIDIPKTVTTIGWYAFEDCENLVSISFSEGLNEIEAEAFRGCSSLKELVFPDSLTELGINYFYECNSLKTLVIPNSVVSTECIGMETLLQNPQLTYLQLPPHILISICLEASNYHYGDEEYKEVGIKITTEKDAMCFSIPMPALCQHLKLRPDCKISVGDEAESTIHLGDIFEGREETEKGEGGSVEMTQLDPLFADVARDVVTKQEGSTSRLQRMFYIGYNRACKLSDQLETVGIIGPCNGTKGRDVLITDLDALEQLLHKLGQA